MIVRELTITEFRGLRKAHLEFKPGINLVVGINGAGKSSVLDALRIGLSSVVKVHGGSQAPANRFRSEDVRLGSDSGEIAISVDCLGLPVEFQAIQFAKPFVPHIAGEVRQQVRKQRGLRRVLPSFGVNEVPPFPLAIYFGPHRSTYVPGIRKIDAVHGIHALYHESLRERPARLDTLMYWWRAFQTDIRLNRAIHAAIRSFLDNASLAEFDEEGGDSFGLFKHGDESSSLILRGDQLSDGERSIIAMIMDIARRLCIANPYSISPLRDGSACILIDELELHLHPQWQRKAVSRLKRTFPNCQFIITTHSPQVIGEVEYDRITLLQGRGPSHPGQSLGMDSAWILRHVMKAGDRSETIEPRMAEIRRLLDKGRLEEAITAIDKVEETFGVFDDLQAFRTRAEIMLRLKQ